ncbi:hypothetical protein AB2B38_003310 [Balneola sp. MJW-20]|uniref:hypothetical protein n=1 Tax=Gracilimonas aurantiaca TaxID=3234185 RepID=UPI0034672C53
MSKPKLLLLLATTAALAVIPDWPIFHLDNPSYWSMMGFLYLTIGLVVLPDSSWKKGSTNRNLIIAFLAIVQLVYIANWIRYGESETDLIIQVVGSILWLIFAFKARQSNSVLWLGCILHALWDAAHFGRVEFIPDWYATACLAADIGIGAFVLLSISDDKKDGLQENRTVLLS